MKNAIITAAAAVTGFSIGALVGCARTFWTYPRRYFRITGYGRKLPQKLTGGSFRESLNDNSDFARSFYDMSGGDSE